MPWFSKMEPLTKCIFLLMDEEHMNTSMLSLLGKKPIPMNPFLVIIEPFIYFLYGCSWMLQEYAGGCRSVQKHEKFCRGVQEHVGACKNMQKCDETCSKVHICEGYTRSRIATTSIDLLLTNGITSKGVLFRSI